RRFAVHVPRKSRTHNRAGAAALSRGERERGNRAADEHRAERSAAVDHPDRLYRGPASDRVDRYILPQRLLRFRRGVEEVAAWGLRKTRFGAALLALVWWRFRASRELAPCTRRQVRAT